jgi:OFA family oxalate/formate antiporter-like MFS transporter
MVRNDGTVSAVKRYRILIAAVVMQMCLGATYAWSIFVLPLKQTTSIFQSTAQLPFSLFYFAFPATMMAAGTLLPKIGPRRCAVIGGLLFGGGWILASLGHFHFGFTILGIGMIAGIGVGFAYIVPIATCVRWFPRHKGLVTGVAVAGFGGGAALVSHAAAALMETVGMSPFGAFGCLGLIFLILVVLAGTLMENPPDDGAGARQPVPVILVLKDRSFAVLYVAMFAGLAAGFAINANMKELCGDAAVRTGVRAVAAFALANAAGRIAWGWMFDRGRSTPVTRSSYGKENENHRRQHRRRPRGLCHERRGRHLSHHPFVTHRRDLRRVGGQRPQERFRSDRCWCVSCKVKPVRPPPFTVRWPPAR